MAAWAKSSMAPGTTPSRMIAVAAMVSATPVPASTTIRGPSNADSSSGGAYEGTFMPGLWHAIGPYLPGGAGLSAFRGIVYFDSANTAGRFTVLAIYAIAGALVTIVVGWRRGPRLAELELAAAASV